MATESGLSATATSEIPSPARVAAAFPQLEILELIGRGAMGFVFKAGMWVGALVVILIVLGLVVVVKKVKG